MKNKQTKNNKRRKPVTIDIKYNVNTKTLDKVTRSAQKAQAAVDKLKVALKSLSN